MNYSSLKKNLIIKFNVDNKNDINERKTKIKSINKKVNLNLNENYKTNEINNDEKNEFDIFLEMDCILKEKTTKKNENVLNIKEKSPINKNNQSENVNLIKNLNCKNNKEIYKKNNYNEEKGKMFKKKIDIVEASFSVINKWNNHNDLIEFVKNNLKNNEFIYVKRFSNNCFEKIDSRNKKETDFMSISPNGVMINEKNESTFYELNEWRNYITLLNSALNLKFVKKFKLYKYFFLLKNLIKYTKFKKKKSYIKENLLFLNEDFFKGFIQIQTILHELSDNKLIDISINNMSIEQFKEIQNDYFLKIDSFIKKKLKHITNIICKYCIKSLNNFLKKNGIVDDDNKIINELSVYENKEIFKVYPKIINKNISKNIQRNNTNVDVYYNKIALSNCYCIYIKRFIHLSQYLCDNTLRNMIINTYEYFLKLLNNYFEVNEEKKSEKNNISKNNDNNTFRNDGPYKLIKMDENDNNTNQNDNNNNNINNNKSKNEICLFNVMLIIENNKLKITPEYDLLINTIMYYINMSLQNLCKREEFFNSFKIKEFFKNQIFTDNIIYKEKNNEDLNYDKNFSNFINSDETISKLHSELKDKMGILYNSMVDVCNDFNDIIKLHNKYEKIDIEKINIMDNNFISYLFTSFKEHENKIKRMNKEINIHLFKVDNTALIDYLLKNINKKWNNLINYLPSLNNQTIDDLTIKLDNSLNIINKTPATIDELVSYIDFANSFNDELVTVEENIESISSLFLLFKKYYINISGNQTTKIFHINQKINSLKSILNNEKNYDLQFNDLYKDLIFRINEIEKKIQNFVNIMKTNILENNVNYSLNDILQEIYFVTPINDINHIYYTKNKERNNNENDIVNQEKKTNNDLTKLDYSVNDSLYNRLSDDINETNDYINKFFINENNEIVINDEMKKKFYTFELLEFLRIKIINIKKDVDKYIYYQKVLKKKKNEFVNFSLLSNMFINNSLTIYTFFKFICYNEKYKKQKIFNINLEELSNEINKINVYFKEINKNFVNNEFYEKCKKFHKTYDNVLKILKLLKVIYKNEKYFKRAIDILNYSKNIENTENINNLYKMNTGDSTKEENRILQKGKLTYNYNNINLSDLFNLSFVNSLPEIENICFEYEKEKKINEKFQILKNTLKKYKVDVSLMNKKIYFINNIDELITHLKQILTELFIIENDKFSKHLYEDMYKLSEQIKNFTNILTAIKKIQTYYLNLQRHKNNELKKFLKLDLSIIIKKYKQQCEEFFVYPQITKHIEKNYDLTYFKTFMQQLKEIIIDAEKHILDKRNEFYAFYLLNDDDFLKVYLDLKDMKSLNSYVNKIFPNIKKIIFQNETICGVLTNDNERIIFKEEIKFKKMEFLLNEISNEIKNSVMKNIHTYVKSKNFFSTLKEDSYLYFININNLQLLFILLNIYFTYVLEYVLKNPLKNKDIVFIISQNISKMIEERNDNKNKANEKENNNHNNKSYAYDKKNWIFILTFFMYIKEKFQNFMNDENNLSTNSYNYLEYVKHHYDKDYYIQFFHHKIKYKYELLNNYNYTLDMIYYEKNYNFLFYKYLSNNFITLYSDSSYSINYSKDFSTLLGFHFFFINNINLQKNDILNFMSCCLSSNISLFFYEIDKYKEDLLSVLNEQLVNISNHILNKKKTIIVNNNEFNLNKKNLIYLSLNKNSFPLYDYFSDKNYNFKRLQFSFSFYQPSKPFSLSIFFLLFFSYGCSKCDILSMATYKAFFYLKQHNSLKKYIDEKKLVNIVKSTLKKKKNEEEFIISKKIIKYVSSFVENNKLIELINNICLIFDLSKNSQVKLLQLVDKKEKEKEQYSEVDSNSQESKDKKNFKNQINKIVTHLIKETKLNFLKYQVNKAIEIYKILNFKSKKENTYNNEEEKKVKHILITGKNYSGVNTIIFLLYNFLKSLEKTEFSSFDLCFIERINISYCLKEDVLKFVFHPKNYFISEQEQNEENEIENSLMKENKNEKNLQKDAINKKCIKIEKEKKKTKLFYNKTNKNYINDLEYIKLNLNRNEENYIYKNKMLLLKFISVREIDLIEKMCNYTLKKNMCSEINKEDNDFNYNCFIFKPDSLNKISPYIIDKFHYININHTIPYISFITYLVDQIKIYKFSKKKIIKLFEDLIIETLNFFKKQKKNVQNICSKEKFYNREEIKEENKIEEENENKNDYFNSINKEGQNEKKKNSDKETENKKINEYVGKNIYEEEYTKNLSENEENNNPNEESKNTKNEDEESEFFKEDVIEFYQDNNINIKIHINTLISNFVKFIEYFLNLLKEKKGFDKKIVDNHLNNIITISFIYAFTSFMSNQLRSNFENYIFKYINNISIIPRNTSFVHIYYNIESNKILRQEKVYKNENIIIDKKKLINNLLIANNNYFIFEDLHILSIKNFLKMSIYLRMPFIIMGYSNSAKSLCTYNYLNSHKKKKNNIYNFMFSFSYLFSYNQIIQKLKKEFDFSKKYISDDITIYLDDINCLNNENSLNTMEFLYNLINFNDFFDVEYNKQIILSNKKIICSLNNEDITITKNNYHSLSKLYKNFFIFNLSTLTTKDIKCLYSNIIESLFQKYNFCEEIINECNNFISCILETFEEIIRIKENNKFYFYTNKINNILNYLLLYDKECSNSINDILILFQNDFYRIFCKDIVSYKDRMNCIEIIKTNFDKYFNKYMIYKNDDLFLNSNKHITIENKSNLYNDPSSKLNISYLKTFFEYDNIEIFYKDIINLILTINSYLIINRTNIIFINNQKDLLSKIITIYCQYKSYNCVFLQENLECIKEQIKETYKNTIYLINKNKENFNNNENSNYNENSNDNCKNIFFSKIIPIDEYLSLFDNVIYNGNLDVLYENFRNEFYLEIINIIKHQEISIEGNFDNYIFPLLLDKNHFLFYTEDSNSLYNNYYNKYKNLFKSCYFVYLNLYNFEESKIFLFNISFPIYNYIRNMITYSFEVTSTFKENIFLDEIDSKESLYFSRIINNLNTRVKNNKKDIKIENKIYNNCISYLIKNTYEMYYKFKKEQLNELLCKKEKCKKIITDFFDQNVINRIKELKIQIKNIKEEINKFKSCINEELIKYKKDIFTTRDNLKRITKKDFEYFKQNNKNNYLGFLKILYLYINKKNDKNFIKNTFSYSYFIKKIKNIDENSINKNFILKYENISNVDKFLNYKFIFILHIFIVSVNNYVKKKDSLNNEYQKILNLEKEIFSLNDQINTLRSSAISIDTLTILGEVISIHKKIKKEIKNKKSLLLYKSILFNYCSSFNYKEKMKFLKLLVNEKKKYLYLCNTSECIYGENKNEKEENINTEYLLNFKNFIDTPFLKKYGEMKLCNDDMIIFNCHLLDNIKEKIIICIDSFYQLKKYLLKKLKTEKKNYCYIKYQHFYNISSFYSGEDNKHEEEEEKEETEINYNNKDRNFTKFLNNLKYYKNNTCCLIFRGIDENIYKILNEKNISTIYIFLENYKEINFEKIYQSYHVIYCDYKKKNILNLLLYYYNKIKNINLIRNFSTVENENYEEKIINISMNFLNKKINEREMIEEFSKEKEKYGEILNNIEITNVDEKNKKNNFILIYVFYLLIQTIRTWKKKYNISSLYFLNIVKVFFQKYNIEKQNSEKDILNFFYLYILSFLDNKNILTVNFILSLFIDIYLYKLIKLKDIFLFFRNYNKKGEKNIIQKVIKNKIKKKIIKNKKIKNEKYIETEETFLNKRNDKIIKSLEESLGKKKNDHYSLNEKGECEGVFESNNYYNAIEDYYGEMCDSSFDSDNIYDNGYDLVEELEKQKETNTEEIKIPVGHNKEDEEKVKYMKDENNLKELIINLDGSLKLLYNKRKKLKSLFYEKSSEDSEESDFNSNYSDYSEEEVCKLKKENQKINELSIIYYLEELKELRNSKKYIFKRLLKSISDNKNEWDNYIKNNDSTYINDFPLKELNNSSMYYYRLLIDKIIKKNDLYISINNYINIKLSDIYIDKKVIYCNFYNFINKIINSFTFSNETKNSNKSNDNKEEFSKNIEKKKSILSDQINSNNYLTEVFNERKQITILLEKNKYSFILLKIFLNSNNVTYLDLKNNCQTNLADIIIVDIKNKEDSYKLENLVNDNLKKIFLIFYFDISTVTFSVIKNSILINFDFSSCSINYLNFLYFIIKSLNYKNVNDNNINSKYIFLVILFFTVINEQINLENLQLDLDLINEMTFLIDLFCNVVNLIKDEEKYKEFFYNYFRISLEFLFSRNSVLIKNMIFSFLCNFFSNKMHKNVLSNINNILKIPTNLYRIDQLIEYIKNNFHLIQEFSQQNKISHICEINYQIKSLKNIFISSSFINKYQKLEIFKLIFSSFDIFSTFTFIKPAINATVKLIYLTEEYNTLLHYINEIKKEIQYFVKILQLSKPLDNYYLNIKNINLKFLIPEKWEFNDEKEKNLKNFFINIEAKLKYLKEIINKEQRGCNNIYNISMFTNPLLFFYSLFFTYATNMNTKIENLNIFFKYSEEINTNEDGIWLEPIKIYKSKFVKSTNDICHSKIHKKNAVYFKISSEENKIDEHRNFISEENETDEDIINKNKGENNNFIINYEKAKGKNFYYNSPYILIKIKKKKNENLEVKVNNDDKKNRHVTNELIQSQNNNLNSFFELFKNNDEFDNNDFVYYCPVFKFNPSTKKNDKLLFFLPLPCIYNKIIYKKFKVHMLL
ncbi:conserved Plasmodium protein, unknown function [Plasmodium relictum]|uniref:Dynein heavy chain C-terminal domain-containing protein n=1 Tax=Plasmodium relictum TaxID=85471 RepID=A0A1J1H6Q7_PLARL|nr:conserved Plasmodium protein, unknown function [Plasmodium relictum]CRG99117.1 conserved Plasmodium protein, unknown function [Plasmodium relictum]